MKILVETQTRKGGWLAVVTFDVTNSGRVPVENVFEGMRRDVVAERNKRCDRWSGIADEVTANAVPGCVQ